jgi:uncharacterized protein (DUF1778 family)
MSARCSKRRQTRRIRVRRKALEAAENDVLNRTIVTIPAKDWEAFEAWAKRPPQTNPGLRALLELTPTWER